METGQLDKIMVYCQKVNYFTDWGFLLTIIVCAREEEAWVMFGSSSSSRRRCSPRGSPTRREVLCDLPGELRASGSKVQDG